MYKVRERYARLSIAVKSTHLFLKIQLRHTLQEAFEIDSMETLACPSIHISY